MDKIQFTHLNDLCLAYILLVCFFRSDTAEARAQPEISAHQGKGILCFAFLSSLNKLVNCTTAFYF